MTDKLITTLDDLIMMPMGTVIIGPSWNSEVYQKWGDVEFYSTGSENSYRASEIYTRGPFRVLWEDND